MMNNNALTMEMICSDENMNRALYACKRKKTTPGPDNMHPCELEEFWTEYGSYIRRLLLQGQYHPMQTRQVSIPKSDNKGTRDLAILTLFDRMIQKAIGNVLQPYFEMLFHEGSYGYRAGRSSEHALKKVLSYLEQGNRYIVMIDIEKYFDNINHKLLIRILKKHIEDERIIVLLRRYIKQRILKNGQEYRKRNGVIQGAPLSPLFANIYLNDFDWKMDELGILFVRFADDILLFAKGKDEAEKVMEVASNFLSSGLFLKVNKEKSRICEPQRCTFLGYGFLKLRDGTYGIITSEKNKKKIYERVCNLIQNTSNCGESYWDKLGSVHRGWINYFGLSEINDLTNFLEIVQEKEMKLLQNVLEEEKMNGNNILQKSFPRSKEFIFFMDWLPVYISKRKRGDVSGE